MHAWCWWLLGCLIGGGILLAGCGGESETPEPGRSGLVVPVFREFKGQQGPFPDRGFLVVQRAEAWSALWDGQPAPEVDFARQSVLVALMGAHTTAGHTITITDVRATGELINAYVTETHPTPDVVTAQVLTYPYHMIVVPKLSQPVSFIVAGATTPVIAIQDAFVGTQSNAVTAQTAVIRDTPAWQLFWRETFGPTAEVPAVDFARYMAVAVLVGRKPTTGYAVRIPAVVQVDDRLNVRYRTRVPQPGEVVAQTATSPYAIALIPVSRLPIAFQALPPLPAPPTVVTP